MGWEAQAISSLKKTDIDLVAYLPDTALSTLIDRVESDDYFDAVPIAGKRKPSVFSRERGSAGDEAR